MGPQEGDHNSNSTLFTQKLGNSSHLIDRHTKWSPHMCAINPCMSGLIIYATIKNVESADVLYYSCQISKCLILPKSNQLISYTADVKSADVLY